MDDRTFDNKEIADQWIELVESGHTRDKDVYPMLQAWVKAHSLIEILDIGAGQGACAAQIRLTGHKYTGVEPSLFLLERAKSQYSHENRTFLHGSAYDLPILESTIDGAFAIAVWHLLEDIKRASRELGRVLKPGGHFLIMTANPEAYSLWMDNYSECQLDGKRFQGQMQLKGETVSQDVLYLHTMEDIQNAFEAAGLKVKTVKTFRSSEAEAGQDYFISIEGIKIQVLD